MWTLFCLLAILITTGLSIKTDICSVSFRDAFRLYTIVPQIIPVTPDTALQVIYGDYTAYFGNDIPPSALTIPPFISWSGNTNTLYTVIGIDPDNPQIYLNNGTQCLFDLRVNIPGQDIESGERLAPYTPPTPLPGSGYHRYIILVFRQRKRINITTDLLISVSTNPGNFSIDDFVERFDLGNPFAGNFFRSQRTLCEPPEKPPKSCVINCAKNDRKKQEERKINC